MALNRDTAPPVAASAWGSHCGRALRFATLAAWALFAPSAAFAAPVAVAHQEGLAHGFLVLRTLDGETLAQGDLTQTTSGGRVKARLHFQFQDGSVREETTVYTQRKYFRLVSNHVVQKGPAFKVQAESTIDQTGRVHVRYSEGDGEEKVIDERLDLPADAANGLTLAVLKNLPVGAKAKVSLVAITPKPRVVELEIAPVGEDTFMTAGLERKAVHYVVKVHIPGVTGALASVLGKIPPDSHVWVLKGDAPAFVKAEMPLAIGGPSWRIELTSPTWPSTPARGEATGREARRNGARGGRRVE